MEDCNRLLVVCTGLALLWSGSPCCADRADQRAVAVKAQPAMTPEPIPSGRRIPLPANQEPRGVSEQVPTPIEGELPAQPSQLSPLEVPAPAGGEVVNLGLPKPEPGDLRFPINLATALRLADERPLVIAAAQASAWVAEAQLQTTKTLWVPTLNFGFNYIRHDGLGPDTLNGQNIPVGQNANGQPDPTSFGRPLSQNVNFLYAGGAFFLMEYSTEMIFQPLAARQNLNAARWNIQAAKNDALLITSDAYFNVHKWRGTYAGAIDVVVKGRRLVAKIDELSRDLVPAVEVDRARNFLAEMEQEAVIARQNWRKSSANLTEVLRLDPRAVVEPLEPDHLQITLIEPRRPLDELMPIALTNRPELASQQAFVQAALVNIRREKMRPFLPIPMLNGFQTPYEQLQFGVNGIGPRDKMNQWYPRVDVAPGMMFQFDSLGMGNAAMVKWMRGEASGAMVQLFRAQDLVAADVTRSQARLQSAAARIVQAERELRGALVNYTGVVEGLGQTKRFGNVLQLVFRPQEAVFSLSLLKLAYDHYWLTVAEYNQAQFRLYHALGYPARELAYFRRTGPILAINTLRPRYLPSVGTGPPPATR
jgi:outer membrane protein TolC